MRQKSCNVLPEDCSELPVWDESGYWFPVAVLWFGPRLSHADRPQKLPKKVGLTREVEDELQG